MAWIVNIPDVRCLQKIEDINEMNSKYGFGKSVDMSFADAVARVTQALQEDDAGHLLEMPFDWQTNPHFMDVALTERRLSCVREYRF